jgi:hypothetical protein
VVAVATLAGLLLHYTRPQNLRPLLERMLSHETGGEVRLGEARITAGGRLTLESMWVQVPGLAAQRADFARLFEAQQVEIQLDFSQLWRGELRVADLHLIGPELHVVEDLDRGQLNIEMLRMRRDEPAGERLRLTLPPAIELDSARVRFAQIKDGRLHTIDAMRLAGELQENPRQDRLYDFELREYDEAARVDAILTGSFNAAAPSLHLNLAGFRVATVHRQLVPPGFRDWWDQLKPTGRLPNLSVVMDADARGMLRLNRAVLELADVGLTPPYAEFSESDQPPAYAPRMTQVSGRFVATQDQVRIEDLTGLIEGVRYYASGRWGFGRRAAGTVALSTDPFTLERNPDFLASLPTLGKTIYDKLSPSGRFQISTRFHRPAVGEPLQLSGVVKLLDARASFYKFPYPLTNIRGLIGFDADAVRLQNLTAQTPGGGTVTLRGEISPPVDGGAVRMAVQARGVPFDETLREAFKPEDRAKLELFLNRPMLETLKAEGVVGRPEVTSETGDSLAQAAEADADWVPPAFELGGNVNADILIDRPRGKGPIKADVTTTVYAQGLSALFRGFPYPLTGESGTVIVERGKVTLNELVVVGPTGGRGVMRGQLIEDPQRPRRVISQVKIAEVDLPIDPLLIGAIRVPQRQIVEDLRLSGRVIGGVTLSSPEDPDDPDAPATLWRAEAQLVDAAAQPNGGDFRLNQIAGGFTIHNRGLTLREVVGRRGEARYELAGDFDWAGPVTEMGLDIDGRDVRVERALLDVLPPETEGRATLVTLAEDHQPDGRVDAQLRWRRTIGPVDVGASPSVRTDYRLDVQPQHLGLTLDTDRLEFPEVGGTLRVTPGQLELEQLRLGFSTGFTTLDGRVGLDGQLPTALTVTASADSHCPYTRKFLPPKASAVLDALEVTGDYRLTDARLLRRPTPGPGQTSLEFDARVRLVDTALTLGVPITQLHGNLQLELRQYADQALPRLDLALDARHLRAADRQIAPLSLAMSNHRQLERLHIEKALGGVYGGGMVASGSVPLRRDGSYRFDLTLSDVAVEPLIRPAEADPTHGQLPQVYAAWHNEPTPIAPAEPQPFSNLDRDLSSGLLSASLHLECPLDEPTARRGRGVMLIRDAQLYDRPLSTALLRATSLALPSGAPLDAAHARYLIEGDEVLFDELALTGPGLSITGGGTMTIPETGLDLVMVSRSTAGPRLGPVSDLIDLFKDELLAIHVTGTLAEPQTGVASLTGLTRGWDSTFSGTGATVNTADNIVGK